MKGGGLRVRHHRELENLTLMTRPVKTLKYFTVAIGGYVWQFMATGGSFVLFIMLAGGIGISTMIIGGRHEKHMQELIRYLQFGLWWLALGVASSIGLAFTGIMLHRSLPYILAVPKSGFPSNFVTDAFLYVQKDALVESFSQQSSLVLYATPITLREIFKNSTGLSRKSRVQKKGGWWRQFWLLLRLAWMQAYRDGPTNKVQERMSVASALIFGSVFWRMGKSHTPIQDRMQLLQRDYPTGQENQEEDRAV